jgi:hypothetical protein
MPQITLDQLFSPLKLDPNDPLRLIISGSLYVSGSSTFRQLEASKPALIVSGSEEIVDSKNVATSSLFVSGGLDGGGF